MTTDGRFDRLEYKMDRLVEIQAEIQVNLSEHMQRTKIAEDNIEKLARTMQPVQQHVALVQGLGKFVAWAAGIGAGIATIVALWK